MHPQHAHTKDQSILLCASAPWRAEVIMHEEYTIDSYDYDLALLRLARGAACGASTSRVRLHDSSQLDVVGLTALVAGWGILDSGDTQYPDSLQVKNGLGLNSESSQQPVASIIIFSACELLVSPMLFPSFPDVGVSADCRCGDLLRRAMPHASWD